MERKVLLSIAFFLFAIILQGQDTIYFNSKGKVNSFEQATYYEVLQHAPKGKDKATKTAYFKSGKLKAKYYYLSYSERKLDGAQKEWYENGQLRQYEKYKKGLSNGKTKKWYEDGRLNQKVDYKKGNLDGRILTYWENGQTKRIDKYKKGKLITGKCFSMNGEEIAHFDYKILPEFPGGLEKLQQYLLQELKYPEYSQKNKIEGNVIIVFAIDTDGSISDIEIRQSANEEMDNEAIRVVKNMPKWIPGKEDGEIIKFYFSLPLQFRLHSKI